MLTTFIVSEQSMLDRVSPIARRSAAPPLKTAIAGTDSQTMVR